MVMATSINEQAEAFYRKHCLRNTEKSKSSVLNTLLLNVEHSKNGPCNNRVAQAKKHTQGKLPKQSFFSFPLILFESY
jgi:hypothetical protein